VEGAALVASRNRGLAAAARGGEEKEKACDDTEHGWNWEVDGTGPYADTLRMEWYFANNNQRSGPFSQDAFFECVRKGEVTPSTLVWHRGMAAWLPWSEVLAGLDPETARLAERPRLPVFVPSIPLAAPASAGFRPVYAPFIKRVGAKIVDILILVGPSMVADLLLARFYWGGQPPLPDNFEGFLEHQALLTLINTVIGIAFALYFIRRYEATPGKLLLGLKLVRADGSPLGKGRIVGRYFAEMLSGLLLGIGYLLPLVDDQKRALHDMVCGTRVVMRDRD
jgi:uncharacterized RDD family membrane protein YckC